MQRASLPPNLQAEGCHKSKDDQPYGHDLGQIPSLGPQFRHLPSGLNQTTSGDLRYHQGAAQSQSSLPFQVLLLVALTSLPLPWAEPSLCRSD